jgi:hypothetical protein
VQAVSAGEVLRLLIEFDLAGCPRPVRTFEVDRRRGRPLVMMNSVLSMPNGPVMPSFTATSRVTPLAASTTLPSQSVLIPEPVGQSGRVRDELLDRRLARRHRCIRPVTMNGLPQMARCSRES